MVKMDRKFLAAVVCLFGCAIYADAIAVMSIDLGNEFIKIGIVKPGIPMEIVLNGDSQRKTATMVAMRNGEREFGNAAQNTAVKYPQDVYMFLRDLVAKSLDNPVVQEFQKRFPYYKLHDSAEQGSILFEASSGEKYSVDELLAMILEAAKDYAERFAEQPITDAVVVVPSYFNQAERRAVMRATSLAGLKLLQLMNDNAAVALNYGVFRRKEFNATAQYYMFYDMGATGTVATIVSYQVVKTKQDNVVETNPQVAIRGIGFDRTLGSLEVTLRLRDHLAQVFNGQKKTPNDVMKNSRGMAKLLKEADRVKKILSANNDTFSQVEGLLDDKDFKTKLSRDEFEALCSDLFARVGKPVEQALKNAGVTMDEITEVILMGGGTRVPKVQELLRKVVGRVELGKSINTDEAAALGAVYQAASLSKGFKVKTFAVKDANIYPIQVEFERAKVNEDGVEASKTVKRVLFSHMNAFPQKKVMTFNKQSNDFNFSVKYTDLDFLDASNQRIFGSRDISHVSVSGVAEAIEKNLDNQTESKGIKAHFELNPSGVLTLENVEFVFEKPSLAEEESTLSKISNTISSFFSGSQNSTEEDSPSSQPSDESEEASPGSRESAEEEDDKDKEEEKLQPDAGQTSDEPSKSNDSDSRKKTAETAEKTPTSDSKDQVSSSADKENEVKSSASKKMLVKEVLVASVISTDHRDPSAHVLKASRELLIDLQAKDRQRNRLEKSKNDIESFIIDVRIRADEDDYKKCSTEDQRAVIEEQMAIASDWLEQQDADTTAVVYEDKLASLKAITRDWFVRVAELRERPKALATLKDMLNHTRFMLTSMRNYTGSNGPFTEVEITALEKLINETAAWKATQEKLQKKKALHETPVFTVDDIAVQIRALDREMKYLLNKAKTYVPKKPKTSSPSAENSTAADTDTVDEPPAGDEDIQPEQPSDSYTHDSTSGDAEQAESDKEGTATPKVKVSKKSSALKDDDQESETLTLGSDSQTAQDTPEDARAADVNKHGEL